MFFLTRGKAALAGIIILLSTPLLAQEYPNRVIRVITSSIGGGSDFTARLIGRGLSPALGQQVIIDNRPPGVIQGELISKAAPDGYTLLVAGSTVWTAPLMQKVSYDPVRDFAPITIAEMSPSLVVVHPSLPIRSVKDLISLAKTRPGELNYASGSTGSVTHLGPELFKSMAGVNIVRVPYKGAEQGLTDLLAGQVHMRFGSVNPMVPHVKAGRLRALAVTSARPSALIPGVGTVAESGLPGYESVGMTPIFAPAKTPAAIVTRLHQEIVRVLRTVEAKEQLLSVGVEVVASSPQELANAMNAEMSRLGKLIKDIGLRVD